MNSVLNRKVREKEVEKVNFIPCPVQVINGTFQSLPLAVQSFVVSKVQLFRPDNLYICDGSENEGKSFAEILVRNGTAVELQKHVNCYAVRTNPLDVARVESKTFICTQNKNEAIPIIKDGVQGQVGFWADIDETDAKLNNLFNGCMKGRTMYIIPFSMGPIGSPLSKIGIQLTDSTYVALSMRIMTRMGEDVLRALKDSDFIRCSHSVGRPLPAAPDPYNWPCNPENTIIAHFPARREIISFGSGYGGNSLLGKKCLALRIASYIGKDEGWLAEHMLILGLTNPAGEKIYIAAAFPSACGKTNLAMIFPTIPGWKAECVGDDIAWMKFDKNGQLRAINPENGFFGVAPGTSTENNPEAMYCCKKDTIFTNVASTSDGTFFWEGLEKERDFSNIEITDWLGKTWNAQSNNKAAHPNSRFCCPAKNCKIMDTKWEDPEGVPISAILFGGRRPEGVPLVYEAFDWKHGVFIASSLCSETTAAAEYTGKKIMRDPFAMRPFFGYNAGDYFQHWLNMEGQGYKLPKIFHVNWFRKDSNGKFLWPGFGENCRVLKWIMERVCGKVNAVVSPVGLLPDVGGLYLNGLNEKIDIEELMSVPTSYWNEQLDDLEKYYSDQYSNDLPQELWVQLKSFRERLNDMNA